VLEFFQLLINMLLRSRTQSSGYFEVLDTMPNTAPLGPDIASTPMWQKARQQVEDLQKIDSNFNEFGFLTVAASAYLQALAAEDAMNPSAASDVVTPAYAARLAQHVDDWKNQGLRRVIRGMKLDGTTLFKVSLDGVSQALVVRISGSGVRYTQDVATGMAAEGSVQNETFTEFATFIRPAGAVTPKSAQAGGATHCPSCGAPAPMSATRCAFCGTPLTASSAPWLLDHISQSAYT
jgi:hypothetical protein